MNCPTYIINPSTSPIVPLCGICVVSFNGESTLFLSRMQKSQRYHRSMEYYSPERFHTRSQFLLIKKKINPFHDSELNKYVHFGVEISSSSVYLCLLAGKYRQRHEKAMKARRKEHFAKWYRKGHSIQWFVWFSQALSFGKTFSSPKNFSFRMCLCGTGQTFSPLSIDWSEGFIPKRLIGRFGALLPLGYLLFVYDCHNQ